MPAHGISEWQALLWEAEVLEQGFHNAAIVSNGDTIEVNIIEYK